MIVDEIGKFMDEQYLASANGVWERRSAMANRSLDWLNQALKDMEQAGDSRRAGRHEWACFAAHQAAEKAVRALHLHLGQDARGHAIAKLLVELPETVLVEDELIEKGRVLDNFYVPTRYPNGHPEGAPFEHYGPLQSGEAIRYASEIVDFVRSKMGGCKDGGRSVAPLGREGCA